MRKVLGSVLASLVLWHQAGYALAPTYAPPPGIKIVEQGDGLLITDAKGIALYTYGGDATSPGKSACNQLCAQQWPPAAAADGAKPQGAWSTIVREDGSLQWAVDGMPLYYHADEGGPGTAFGDGENGNSWHVAVVPIRTPPGVTIKNTTLGTVLADFEGLTLYTRERDTVPNKSTCTKPCVDNFAPVTAPALALANGEWTVVTRDDGSQQWAYKGKPLYRSLMDVKPADTNGVDQAWRAAVLQPAPPLPPWVTLQQSLGGEVLADAHELTLYARGVPRRPAGTASPVCATATCMGNIWKAVLADDGAKPIGNWTIISNQDGTRQRAFKGRRLYTSTFDSVAGDLKGRRHGDDRAWRVMTRGGDCPDLC